MQVEVEIQKLDGLIFKTKSEQGMSSRLRADDDNVILIGRGDDPSNTSEIVRIGLNHGYHRWRETMYEDKCKLLKSLLDRINEKSVDKYVRAMEDLVDGALKCYVQPAKALRGETVEMMLLDSCFILELFRMFERPLSGDINGPIFHKRDMNPNFLPTLRRDLLRVGNQLPLFVLRKILEITPGITRTPNNLIDRALYFLGIISCPYNFVSMNLIGRGQLPPEAEIHSLLELVYYVFVPRRLRTLDFMNYPDRMLEFINYATELQEAGVKFKKNESRKKFYDIVFKKNGVLEIPPLQVSDDILYDLQNLMEFEKQLHFSVPRPINDYAKFIQCLVNFPNDVKLLRRCGIIDNWLGSDEVIFNRLNELGSKAEISSKFLYNGLLKNVNEHCRRRQNVWMANLRRNYFNNPCTCLSLLSLLAAVDVLLLLTMTQTVYSILSFHLN